MAEKITESEFIRAVNSDPKMILGAERNGYYICQFCGAGTNGEKAGLISKDNGRHWTCTNHGSKDCPENEDLFTIAAKRGGILYPYSAEDRKAAIQTVCQAVKYDYRDIVPDTLSSMAASHMPTQASAVLGDWIKQSEAEKAKAIPTGYKCLDSILDGGLYPGLYVLGANSSTGKTTYLLQMADQIAQSGQDVLIFSLEMSAGELISKSISRNTAYATQLKKGLTIRNALSYKSVNQRQTTEPWKSLKNEGVKLYKQYAQHVYIAEAMGDIGIREIREAATMQAAETGVTPVIFVDYLQIIAAPENDRGTDKQHTDRAITALRRLSKDLKTSIVVISSLNRASYTGPVNMDSFKESGAIEYSADVLLGLQLEGMDDLPEEKGERAKQAKALQRAANDKMKAGQGADLQVKVLKNRNGSKDESAHMLFYAMYNIFIEKSN